MSKISRDDLIKAQPITDILQEAYGRGYANREDGAKISTSFFYEKYLDILASLDPWIKVEDGLPEEPKEGDRILLRSEKVYYPEANEYNEGRWLPSMTRNDRLPAFFTHWMPIPPITEPKNG